jgi:hypothetical protein
MVVCQKIASRWLVVLLLFVLPVEEGFANEGHHYFGGHSVSLSLKTIVQPCGKIRAQLYATTQAMEAPIGDPVLSDCSKPLQIGLPEVRVKTKFILAIESLTEKGWVDSGNIPLQAYPQKLLTPLRDWAEENDLVVADSDGKLEQFLEKQNIPFTVNHRKTLKSPAVHVVAGRGEILFKEEAEGIPKILVKGKTVLIEMPFLDKLPTHPSFQYELIKIFEEIL